MRIHVRAAICRLAFATILPFVSSALPGHFVGAASRMSQSNGTDPTQQYLPPTIPKHFVYLPLIVTRSLPDAFEPDDTCATASRITPGTIQTRTFAVLVTITPTAAADIDIIQVSFALPGSYDARVAATDPQLSPRVEFSGACGTAPLDAFTPDSPVRLVVPSANYTLYFRATSRNPNIARLQNTAYRISLSGLVMADRQAADADDDLSPRVVILPEPL